MPRPTDLVPADRLWQRLQEVTASALLKGALVPIETRFEPIEQNGIRFLLRIAANLRRKAADRTATSRRPANPFLPPEPELLLGAVSPGHLAVLNKFNVMEHHLLLVTRSFEHQETLLNAADFAALGACLQAFPSLGFYNGGSAAGASQMHKHLQLVPLPLEDGVPSLPIQPLVDKASRDYAIGRLPDLAFPHAFCRLEAGIWQPRDAGNAAQERYRSLLSAIGIGAVQSDGEPRQSGPYNLLITERWMLAVPRRCEHAAGISINALGFAGSLFVTGEADRRRLLELGPMEILKQVAGQPAQGWA